MWPTKIFIITCHFLFFQKYMVINAIGLGLEQFLFRITKQDERQQGNESQYFNLKSNEIILEVGSGEPNEIDLENVKSKVIQANSTFRNPIWDGIAPDPYILKHEDFYYMVFTQWDQIEILKSPILSNFRKAQRSIIYSIPRDRQALHSPKIYNINDEFYIYFNMRLNSYWHSDRMYVIKCQNSSNLLGNWSSETPIMHEDGSWAQHPALMQYGDNGTLYLMWARGELYIAKMTSPSTVAGPRALLKEPNYTWEGDTLAAPIFTQINGKMIVVYSANMYGRNACLGMIYMDYDVTKDPMDEDNWKSNEDECAFAPNWDDNVWRPSHAAFVLSPDETELWMVYDAAENFYDVDNTTAHIQKIEVDSETDLPRFPKAAGLKQSLEIPKGE